MISRFSPLVLAGVLLAVPTDPPRHPGDVNGDSRADIADVLYLLNWLFTFDAPPPPPFVLTIPARPVLVKTEGDTLTVSWQRPTENEDGTPLEDLQAFRIYVAPVEWVLVAEVPAEELTVALDSPGAGQWIVTATAVDTSANESRYAKPALLEVRP